MTSTPTQILTLPWVSTHRRRETGPAGLPTLSPPLQAGEAVANVVDAGGFIAYWGTGNDGNGNATAGVPFAGQGFIDSRVQAGSVASIAALRAVPFAALAAVAPRFGIDVKSYYAGGGGQGGGRFVWIPNSTAVDDGGSVINPTGNTGAGRFLRLLPLSYLTPEMFGAKGDGVTDDSAAFQAALNAAGAGPVPLMCAMPSYNLALAGQISVPTAVSIIAPTAYAGTDFANQVQMNFSTGGGGFYAGAGASFYGLRLTGTSSATLPLIECKGQVGVYNCHTEGSPSAIRASNKVLLGWSVISGPNVQISPSSGLTNGTYSKVPFTGGGTTAATVSVVVTNGAISSITFDTAGTVAKADFMMGFAAGALYSGSPAITNAGEALVSPMGRSRFSELWMVGHTAVALEVRAALDFCHFNNVHIWFGAPVITPGSIAFQIGHLDGGAFVGCKVFAYDTGFSWECPSKGNNSFAAITGLEMDYVNNGQVITGPMKLDFATGYQQNLGKCFNIQHPLAVVKISMNLFSVLDDNIVATDFALLNVHGCNFERNLNNNLFCFVIQPSSASKGVVSIGNNTSDGNSPFAFLSGAVVGTIAPNQWSPNYPMSGTINGYVNASGVTGGRLTVCPIRFGSFTGTTDANGRVAIPHTMGSPGPLAPRVDMSGAAGAAGYRGVVIAVDSTNINVQCLTASGSTLAPGTTVTMYYSA